MLTDHDIYLFREGTTPSYPNAYGEAKPPRSEYLAFAHPDGVEIKVAAGKYRAVVTRGFEYDLAEQILDVASGQRVEANFKLTRVVDTTDGTDKPPDLGLVGLNGCLEASDFPVLLRAHAVIVAGQRERARNTARTSCGRIQA